MIRVSKLGGRLSKKSRTERHSPTSALAGGEFTGLITSAAAVADLKANEKTTFSKVHEAN